MIAFTPGLLNVILWMMGLVCFGGSIALRFVDHDKWALPDWSELGLYGIGWIFFIASFALRHSPQFRHFLFG